MQISKLYETKLECSSYNVTIGSTTTTVTLTLVDFNGSPVTNTAVTLKADKGYFTKAVGKTTTTYTDASNTKTINATTDNNGKVVATWTASDLGLCTFSANNTNVQTFVNNSKLYETKLECSSYNVNIDSTTTTVTLTLVDFNGSPVTNTAVTLKADKGYFTKAVGKTTTTYTDASNTKTINATTDDNGKVVATWTASEWGLCTFSANNTTIQIHSNGFREVTPTGEQYCRVWINKTTRVVKVTGARNITVSSSNKDTFIQYSSGQIISSEFYPETHVYSPTSLPYCTLGFSIESGTVRVKSSAVISSSTACGAYFLWSY